MRLIDADALTDEIMERYCKECDNRKGIKNGKYRIIYEVGDAPCRACLMDDMKDELDNAPTIEPERAGKWILCSERLPEKYSDVLCCDTYGEYIIGMPYEDEESNTGFSVENDGVYMIDCIAWMPLPEPYCPNCGARMEP